jgi:hypothetical protein
MAIDWILSIGNFSNSHLPIVVSSGTYSQVKTYFIAESSNDFCLENGEGMEFSIESHEIGWGHVNFDWIKAINSQGRISQIIIEPSSLDSRLCHFEVNELNSYQDFRQYGVGYIILFLQFGLIRPDWRFIWWFQDPTWFKEQPPLSIL